MTSELSTQLLTILLLVCQPRSVLCSIEGTSTSDNQLTTGSESECCQNVLVKIGNDSAIFTRDEHPVNGSMRYHSNDTSMMIAYCEEKDHWEIKRKNDDDCTAVFAYAPDGPYDCPDEVASTWNTEEDDGNALGNITVECSASNSTSSEAFTFGTTTLVEKYPDPVVLVIGASGVGKSTVCNFLAGFSDGDPNGFDTGTPITGESVTKTAEVRRVQWRGTGKYLTIVDTPGLSDPAGKDTDREQFKNVLSVLKYQVGSISAIIHVVKGTETRKLPHVRLNLQLFKFMFGEAMKTNLINYVSFWSHYEHMHEEDRDDFRARRDLEQQELFNEPNITVPTVFVDPIDALPRSLMNTKLNLYRFVKGSKLIQEEELEKLETFIWNQTTQFHCSSKCNYVEGIFDTRSPYPTVKSGDQYGLSRYEVMEQRMMELHCFIAALHVEEDVEPNKIFFLHDGTKLRDGFNISGGKYDDFLYRAVLTIQDTNLNHSGSYDCQHGEERSKQPVTVTILEKIDCEWSEWAAWTDCSRSCDGGLSYRTRRIVAPASNGGKSCLGESIDYHDCNIEGCPEDCKWTSWSPWLRCSATCGGGHQTRTRTQISAENGGRDCTGEGSDTRKCKTQGCPVNCAWSGWTWWTKCDDNCERKRTRTTDHPPANGGTNCNGPAEMTEQCDHGTCSGLKAIKMEISDYYNAGTSDLPRITIVPGHRGTRATEDGDWYSCTINNLGRSSGLYLGTTYYFDGSDIWPCDNYAFAKLSSLTVTPTGSDAFHPKYIQLIFRSGRRETCAIGEWLEHGGNINIYGGRKSYTCYF